MAFVLPAPPSPFAKMRIRRALAQQLAFEAAQRAAMYAVSAQSEYARIAATAEPGTVIEFPPTRRH